MSQRNSTNQSSNLTNEEYLGTLRAIEEAITFFNEKCGEETYAGVSDCTDSASHTTDRLMGLKAERADRIRVLVMGEFKAGKSTLLNALVGKQVSATDVFEMTTIVCRIIPVTSSKEKIVLSSPNTNTPEKIVTLKQFLDLSVQQAQALREGDKAQIIPYTLADLYIQTPFDVELVDTPGLGATLENELNAVDAITSCDVILWAINAQSLGGTRENAILERIQSRNQPLLCVITKIDTLQPHEIEDAREYVLDEYGVNEDSLFLISASNALQGNADPGLDALRNHLLTKITPYAAELRQQAYLAQAVDVSEEATEILKQINSSLSIAIERVEEVRGSFLAMAEVITQDVSQELKAALRRELRTSVFKSLEGFGGNSSKPIDEKALFNATEKAVKAIDPNTVLSGLNIEQRYEGLWLKGLDTEIKMMTDSLLDMQKGAASEANTLMEHVTKTRIDQANKKKAAVTDILKTLEDISERSYSIFNFVALMVTKIPGLVIRLLQNHSSSNHLSLEAVKKAFSDWVDSTIDALIEEQFTVKFRKRNHRVAEQAANQYATRQEKWAAPLPELYEIRDQCHAIYMRLGGTEEFSSVPREVSEGEVVDDDIQASPIPEFASQALQKLRISLTKSLGKDKADGISAADELERLIGLSIVKSEIETLTNYVSVQQMRRQSGLDSVPLNLHMVFSGNPGTGKTTVARLLGRVFHSMDLLQKGHVVETGRSGLVAEYVGQTAIKVREVIQKSLGGILFIDEAYTLTKGGGKNDFGLEAVETLLLEMENHRGEFVVVVAGYPNEMDGFLRSNPGLSSRFTHTLHFEDYTPDELTAIFLKLGRDKDYTIVPAAKDKVHQTFVERHATRDERFGNGRDVRNLFDEAIRRQSSRIIRSYSGSQPTPSVLCTLLPDDIPSSDAR